MSADESRRKGLNINIPAWIAQKDHIHHIYFIQKDKWHYEMFIFQEK